MTTTVPVVVLDTRDGDQVTAQSIASFPSNLSDRSDSNPAVVIVEACGNQFDKFIFQLNQWPDAVVSKTLNMVGIFLQAAAGATVTATFTLSSPQPQDVVIPAGTSFATADGSIQFTTTWDDDFQNQPRGFQRNYEEWFLPWAARYDSVYGLGSTAAEVKQTIEGLRSRFVASPLGLTDGSQLEGVTVTLIPQLRHTPEVCGGIFGACHSMTFTVDYAWLEATINDPVPPSAFSTRPIAHAPAPSQPRSTNPYSWAGMVASRRTASSNGSTSGTYSLSSRVEKSTPQ